MKTAQFAALAILLISAGAFSNTPAQEHPKNTEHPKTTEHPASTGDIFAILSGTGNFKSLVTAIKAAGLEEKLQGKGPFTVFAPTDEAFAKLPAGTLEDLLKPANKAKLAGLLANHVVPGTIMAAQIKTMKAANISGQDLVIQVADGAVSVNNARVVQADLIAANGVIHAVDAVIVPAALPDKAASQKPKDHPAH